MKAQVRKGISSKVAKQLKIDRRFRDLGDKHKTINNLIKCTPNYVTAKSESDQVVEFNTGHRINILKDKVYVMSLGQFMTSKRPKDNTKRNTPRDRKMGWSPYRVPFKDLFNRYQGQDLNNKSLVVWRSGGLGDLMTVQSILKYLRHTYPTCRITFGSVPGNLGLCICWPQNIVNNYITIPFEVEVLKLHDYHMVFEGVVEGCEEIKKLSYLEAYQKTAGVKYNIDDFLPTLIPDRKALTEMYQNELVVKDNTIMIQMNSSSPSRAMSDDKWARIIDVLVDRGYIIGIVEQSNKFRQVQNFLDSNAFPKDKVINYSKYCTQINFSISLASLATGFIAIDSSFAHFAPALGVPCVGIYGPYPGFNVAKHYKRFACVDPVGYDGCGHYPCYFNHGECFTKCPFVAQKKYPGCLDSIDPITVADKLQGVLKDEN